MTLLHRLLEVAKSSAGRAERLHRRRSIVAQWLVEHGSLFAALSSAVVDSYAELTHVFPWHRSFLLHDPAENLKRIRCPACAFFGELDTTVPPAAHLPRCSELLRSADSRSKSQVISPLTHTLAIADDRGDDPSFSPALLTNVCDWICLVAKPQAKKVRAQLPPVKISSD